MANFGPKPRTNPFGKISIFRLFQHLILKHRKAFFRSGISYNTFSWPILPKKTPLERSKYLDFFNMLFYSLERRFFALEYHTTHFPGLHCLKKKDGKMANFGPKPWTNPFEKSQFFNFFYFLFLYPRKAFFQSRISYNKFSCPRLPKKKKNGQFWTKTMD